MKYFAYGSNMLTERLTARVSSVKDPRLFTLRKHRLRFHKKSNDCSGKCNIVATECDNDVVYGVLFEVEDAQISALDRAEGVGYGYRRDEIAVSLGGTETKMSVYVAEESAIDDALVPYEWYYDLVLAGAEQHALPGDYVAGLRAMPFTQDPKPDREGRLNALEALRKYSNSKKEKDEMPYKVNSATYSVSKPLPQNLGHKPVYAMPYQPFDGYAPGNTDARYLSIGLAQYNENKVSVKTMRHTGDQWSPQAEELPVHRVIDLALFAAKSLFDSDNGAITLPGGLFCNQLNCITISQEPSRNPTEIASFDTWCKNNEQLLKERLNALGAVLDDLRRKGKI